MTQRYRSPNLRPIHRVKKEIRNQQRQDAKQLRGAIVGRGITHLPGEKVINRSIIRDGVGYEHVGHIAVVYLFRNELRTHWKSSFFNSMQVNMAIEKIGVAAARKISVGRSELDVVQAPYTERSDSLKNFWLVATAGSAHFEESASNGRVNLGREELVVANELFQQDMDTTGAQQLWLGALTARSIDAARDALDTLEGVIPPRLHAGPVRLLSSRC